MSDATRIQERHPNFRDHDGQLFLVRCFVCDPERGVENHAGMAAAGKCAWCGWSEAEDVPSRDSNE